MKPDITSREDIYFIVKSFYNKLLIDENMFPFFKEIVDKNTLNKHLETITDFWEDILFNTHNYKENPMQKHIDFHKKTPFKKDSFVTWLEYFSSTISYNFSGNNAETMKNRANSIAMVMQLKLDIYKK